MALGATCVWAVQTTGSDSNGGGFATVTTNMATDLAATDGNTAAPVVTSASYTFIARDVGHWVYVAAGTNWTAGWYKIASVAGGAATLDADVGEAVLIGGLSLNTVAGCATVASPTSGTWSVDYSQSDAGIAFTDLVISGATNTDFTSALDPMGKNFIGNIFNVTSGSGFTVQRVQIISIPSGVIARADKSMGTLSSTGGNATGGGALVSPGQAGALRVAGNKIFVKAGTYTMADSSNVSGGFVTLSGTDPTTIYGQGGIIGFQSIRADYGTKPLFQPSATATECIVNSASNVVIDNIQFSANGQTVMEGIRSQGTICLIRRCYFSGGGYGIRANTCQRNIYLDCEATGQTTIGIQAGEGDRVIDCTAHDMGVSNGCFASVGAASTFINCIAYNNTSGPGFNGNGISATAAINCVAYNCDDATTGDGFVATGVMINCLSVSCQSEGFNAASAFIGKAQLLNCAGYDNGSNVTAGVQTEDFITLTANPFTNAAAGDFTLNNTAGGGALLKGTGFPQTFPGLAAANYPNVGAYQHEAAAGGGGLVNQIVKVASIGTY